jgi:hypothetical protein
VIYLKFLGLKMYKIQRIILAYTELDIISEKKSSSHLLFWDLKRPCLKG